MMNKQDKKLDEFLTIAPPEDVIYFINTKSMDEGTRSRLLLASVLFRLDKIDKKLKTIKGQHE